MPARQAMLVVVEAVAGQTDLMEVVQTRCPRGSPPHFLNGREQKPDQDPNDANDGQHLNEGHTAANETIGENHGGNSATETGITTVSSPRPFIWTLNRTTGFCIG